VILLAALIAPDHERALKSRESCDSIRLGKGDSMPEENILPNMKPMILADYHPAITAVFPHTTSSKPSNVFGILTGL